MISSSEEPGMKKQKQKQKKQQNLREALEKLFCPNQKSCLESDCFLLKLGKESFWAYNRRF